MARFLLFVALIGQVLAGQGPGATGTVRGKVLDATTKEGIRKATVTAMPATPPAGGGMRLGPTPAYRALTMDDGSYVIEGLPAGMYTVRAERAGYLPGGRTDHARATVAAGEEAKAEELLLARHGSVSGRVTDQDGDPVEGAVVRVIQARGRRGGSNQAVTDDRGQYRIARLPAGRYRLEASKNVHASAAIRAAGPGQPPQVDAPTYYPGVADAAGAAVILLGGGEEKTGMDIRLRRSAAVRVSGRLTGELQANMPLAVNLAGESGSQFWSAIVGADGGFVFENVLPGEYQLFAQQGRPDRTYSGRMRLRVGEQDVTGVDLAMAPQARVTVRAVTDGSGKMGAGPIGVQFRNVDGGMGGFGTSIAGEGQTAHAMMMRGRVAVMAGGVKGWYLKALAVNGQRVTGLEMDVAADMTVDLVFSNRPGKVEGKVEEGATEERVAVLLARDGAGAPVFTNLYNLKAVPAGRTEFLIEDVTPGDYYLLCTMPGLTEALSDPAVWERLKDRAGTVKVEEGVTATAKVRLIRETDVDQN